MNRIKGIIYITTLLILGLVGGIYLGNFLGFIKL